MLLADIWVKPSRRSGKAEMEKNCPFIFKIDKIHMKRGKFLKNSSSFNFKDKIL